MIWQVWSILVLAGLGSAYLAFVAKRAPVYTSLMTVGIMTVAALGSLQVETQFTTSAEYGVSILFGLNGVLAMIVFVAAITGQYGDPDPEDTPTGAVETTKRGGLLDRIVQELT